MCTVVLLRRPGHDWPLLMAANRDERVSRAWDPPARHWPDRKDVIAGRDREANGSWLGMNDHRVVAAILNRSGSLGPAPDKRSRGELVLEALDHAAAADAAEALSELDTRSYKSFNLIVADAEKAFWIRGEGNGAPTVSEVPEGISIFTAHDMNDVHASPRTRHYLPLFQRAQPPNPQGGDWAAWEELVASREMAEGQTDANAAIHVETDWGFGTVSTSLIALPALTDEDISPKWRFAEAWPTRKSYRDILA